MILTDEEIRKAAEFAAEQMWPESGYVGWTEDDAVFHRKFMEACLEKLRGGVELPEPFAHAAYEEHPSYEGVGDIVYYHPNAKPANCIDLFTRNQVNKLLAARALKAEQAGDIPEHVALMCEAYDFAQFSNVEQLNQLPVSVFNALHKVLEDLYRRTYTSSQPAAQEQTSAVPVVKQLVDALEGVVVGADESWTQACKELNSMGITSVPVSNASAGLINRQIEAIDVARTAIAAGQKFIKENGK